MKEASRTIPNGLTLYKIKQGDTIQSIAKQFLTTLNVIFTLNPTIHPRNLTVGDTLLVPLAPKFPECSKGTYYVVQKGDTISKIARYFRYSENDLYQYDQNIHLDSLNIGQTIVIPTKTPFQNYHKGTIPYEIKQGDTLLSIADDFKLSVKEMIMVNSCINPLDLKNGSEIAVPVSWTSFFNQSYRVSFMYPDKWHRTESIQKTRYEGKEGFMEISSICASPMNQPKRIIPLITVAKNMAFANKSPYGILPKVEELVVDGMKGCFILPSEDQCSEYIHRASLLLAYPQPFNIGGEKQHYFVLHAHKDYIRGITRTLKLLNVNKEQKHVTRVKERVS